MKVQEVFNHPAPCAEEVYMGFAFRRCKNRVTRTLDGVPYCTRHSNRLLRPAPEQEKAP